MLGKKEVRLNKYEAVEEIMRVTKLIKADIVVENNCISVNNVLVNDLEMLIGGLLKLDYMMYRELIVAMPQELKQLLSSGLVAKGGNPTEAELAHHIKNK